MCGPCMPPESPPGTSKFGFTVGDRVEVVEDQSFQGYFGHIRSFGSKVVAVDLDEPPPGQQPSGQWFSPSDLKLAPLTVLLRQEWSCNLSLRLQRKPEVRQPLALKGNGSWEVTDGLYDIVTVTPPNGPLAQVFDWVITVRMLRVLADNDQPINAIRYE